MYCKKCGSEIKENQKYCPKCGEKILLLDNLYNMLKNNRECLTSGEILALIKDFENKSTAKIELNNPGNYIVSFNDDTHFNGVLVYKPKEHRVQDFKVEQSKDNTIVYQIENNSKIIAVNAEIAKYDLTKKTDIMNESNFNDNKKKSPLNIIGNIFWVIFGGLIDAVSWWLLGALWCITIIGIPIGKQCFKFAKLTLLPFGKEIIYGTGTASVLLNILWLIFTGLWSAVTYALIGVIFCITIIGIPFGIQYFKFAKLMLMPFGATIVDKQKEE